MRGNFHHNKEQQGDDLFEAFAKIYLLPVSQLLRLFLNSPSAAIGWANSKNFITIARL